MDNIIEAKELQIERKHFHVEFREKRPRQVSCGSRKRRMGRRNTIIVPSTGVDEFTAAIGEVLAGAEKRAQLIKNRGKARLERNVPADKHGSCGGRRRALTHPARRTNFAIPLANLAQSPYGQENKTCPSSFRARSVKAAYVARSNKVSTFPLRVLFRRRQGRRRGEDETTSWRQGRQTWPR